MKHLILSIVISLLFASAAYAEDEIANGLLKPDENGKVIIEQSEVEYILHEADVEKFYGVQSIAPMTLSTNHFSNGIFDNEAISYDLVTYSGSNELVSSDYLIDNNINTLSNINRVQIKFDDDVSVFGFFVDSKRNFTVTLISNDIVVYQKTWNGSFNGYVDLENVTSVDYIEIVEAPGDYVYTTLSEFEVFGDIEVDYQAVSEVSINTKDTSALLSYKNPESKFYTYTDVLINDEVVVANTTNTTHDLNDLEVDKLYNLTLRSYYKDGKYIDFNTSFRTKKDITPTASVENLVAQQVGNFAELTWINPEDEDFSHLRIFRNGNVIASKIEGTSYVDEKAPLNTNLKYRVIAVDKTGNMSSAKEVDTKLIGTEVYNVKAQAKSYDKVDISWQNPARDDFEIVTIYRKKSGIMPTVFSFFSADDGYQQLFQTNGTIFNDMTVAQDTSYTYKLTSTLNDEETAGITVDVKTPKVTVSGGGTELDDTHYTITWDKPTTGEMKILVGGTEYTIVPAANKEIKIPKADMVLDVLGRPDVKLVPVSDDGTEGTPSSPGGNGNIGNIVGGANVSEVLNANNLLTGGVQLIGVVGAFILLGLAFFVTPKLIEVITTAYHARRRA